MRSYINVVLCNWKAVELHKSYFHCIPRTCWLATKIEILPNDSLIKVTLKDCHEPSYQVWFRSFEFSKLRRFFWKQILCCFLCLGFFIKYNIFDDGRSYNWRELIVSIIARNTDYINIINIWSIIEIKQVRLQKNYLPYLTQDWLYSFFLE